MVRFLSAAIAAALFASPVSAFAPQFQQNAVASPKYSRNSLTALNAIGVLARKAKEAEVRQYCEAGLTDLPFLAFHAFQNLSLPNTAQVLRGSRTSLICFATFSLAV